MNARTLSKPLLGFLFLISALALAMAAPEERRASYSERARRVRVAEVSSAGEGRSVRFSGVIRAVDRAELAFSVGARLASRAVETGQAVEAGARIARLDDREMRNAVAVAQAGLADASARRTRAESERLRVERLFRAGAATTDELERATAAAEALLAARDAAAAHLREAERLRGEATLVAPFAGVVTEVNYEPGEFVPPGRPVVVLSGGGGLEAEVRLPESLIAGIRTGDRVRVELPIAGLATGGTLERVGRAAASGGGLYPALVRLDLSDSLLPGMTAEIVFQLAAEDSLAVPLAAVLNPGGARPRVFRLQGEVVEPVDIEVIRLTGNLVSVRAELAAGDLVVVAGHTALVPGDRVEVVR